MARCGACRMSEKTPCIDELYIPLALGKCELALAAWLYALGLDLQRSLIRRSSKSLHVGMMESMSSDQTMRTRSSRYRVEQS